MTDLNKFLTDVTSRHLQKTSRFRCRININFPEFPNASRLLREGLVCQSTSIPDRSFEKDKVTFYGYEQEYPIYNVYSNLSCQFLLPFNNNSNNEVLHLFQSWLDYIQPAPTIVTPDPTFNFPDEYRLRGNDGFVLETFGVDDVISGRYAFEGIYPSQLSEIQLNWSDVESLLSLPVTFSFMYWVRLL